MNDAPARKSKGRRFRRTRAPWRRNEDAPDDAMSDGGHDGSSDSGPQQSPDSTELFVSVGRKDGARASDFYSVLQERAGITIDDTNYVNVEQQHTFGIGLHRDLVERALEALNGAVIAGRAATAEPARQRF